MRSSSSIAAGWSIHDLGPIVNSDVVERMWFSATYFSEKSLVSSACSIAAAPTRAAVRISQV